MTPPSVLPGEVKMVVAADSIASACLKWFQLSRSTRLVLEIRNSRLSVMIRRLYPGSKKPKEGPRRVGKIMERLPLHKIVTQI